MNRVNSLLSVTVLVSVILGTVFLNWKVGQPAQVLSDKIDKLPAAILTEARKEREQVLAPIREDVKQAKQDVRDVQKTAAKKVEKKIIILPESAVKDLVLPQTIVPKE